MKNLDLINTEDEKEAFSEIAVIGLGYVGLPLAVEFAKKGIKVTGIERNLERVNAVNGGKSYIDDVPDEVLNKVIKSGNLKAYQNYEEIKNAQAVVICVPTPLTKNKTPDISYIVSVSQNIARFLKKGMLVVLESTTYPGTTEEVVLPILAKTGLKPGKDFYLAFSPERIDPGNKEYHTGDIPKVVGGINEESTEMAALLYKRIVPSVFKVSSPKAAEMTKLLENTFRLVNVALVDELAMLSEKIGIDIWEVIEAAKTKPYGFMPFYPGPGIGGHCIPIDPFYLLWKAKEYDVDLSFIELAEKVNDSMPEYVINKISYALNFHKKPINGSNILILGVSYKKDISDIRESPALKIISELMKWDANISYYDPFVPHISINSKNFYSLNKLTAGSLSNADCTVILANHSLINYDFVFENSALIVDTRDVIKTQSSKVFKLGCGKYK